MKLHKISIHQQNKHLTGNIPLNLLQSLLTILKEGSARNLQLLIERRSTGSSSHPLWINQATDFIVDWRNCHFTNELSLEIALKCPTLQELNIDLEELVIGDFYSKLNQPLTSLDYFQQTIRLLSDRHGNSIYYDRSLIRQLKKFLASLKQSQASVEFMLDYPLCLTAENFELFSQIESAIPKSNHVRIGGYIRRFQPITHSCVLSLADDQMIQINLDRRLSHSLENLLHRPAIIEGMAHYMANEKLLRVDAHSIFPVAETEMLLWSQYPKPLYGSFNVQELHVPQTPETGLGAIFGKWPGNETDEEIQAYLEELS